MGYKLYDDDNDMAFGTAIGCIVAFPVALVMVVIFMLSMSAPGYWDRTPWWHLAIVLGPMTIATFGVFWLVKKVSDRLVRGSLD